MIRVLILLSFLLSCNFAATPLIAGDNIDSSKDQKEIEFYAFMKKNWATKKGIYFLPKNTFYCDKRKDMVTAYNRSIAGTFSYRGLHCDTTSAVSKARIIKSVENDPILLIQYRTRYFVSEVFVYQGALIPWDTFQKSLIK